MTSLPRFSVENPVLANLFMVTLIAGGVFSGLTIIRELFPESRPNRVLVQTAYPGASPREVEKGIVLKIEEKIEDVDGVEKVRSEATEGYATIFIELESGFNDIDQAVNDVKAAIDTIPSEDFPEEAKENAVSKFDPKWPVISVALYGEIGPRALKVLGERLREDMLALPNVTDVVVSGTRKDEISVEVRPEKLAEFGLSFLDVAEAIRSSNLDLPGGQVRTSSANVAIRTLGEKDRGEDLYDIVIRGDALGRVVRVRDVARIVDGFEDVDVLGRFNGAPAVNVTAYKTEEQDAIAIAKRVRALVAGKMGEALETAWVDRFFAGLTGGDPLREIYERAAADPYGEDVSLALHTDLSKLIEGRLDLLTRNGVWGLMLVALSLLAFLHWRAAVWVMMGLLLAVMGSLICMRLLGHTLNLITMFGLIIVLGLLVDDAIIVSEHVYSKVEAGMDPKRAAIEGTEAVTWPVVCAILTTIVAFIPLMFIEGQIGDWIGTLPVIVCIALSVSLFEALTILPAHLAHGLRPLGRRANGGSTTHANPIVRWAMAVRRFESALVRDKLRGGYERFVRIATDYRYVTMTALLAVFIVTMSVVASGIVPFEFLQKIDSETLVVELKMEVGTPVDATQEALKVVERAAMDLPELKTIYTLIGLTVSDDGLAGSPQSHVGQIFIELLPSDARDRSSDTIVQVLRGKTQDIPGVQRLKYRALQGGPGGEPIHVEISGDRVDDLVAVADELKASLNGFEGVLDIADDFDAGRREVKIELFDSARALGLTTESLATQVRSAFYGYEARKVQRGREDVKIMVRYPLASRERVYDIESMRIVTPSGVLVPFSEVARIREGTGFASIKRTDQRRTVTVTADVDNEIVPASDVILAALGKTFPSLRERFPGLDLAFGGRRLETRKSFGSLKQSFLFAVVAIYVILASLFRSYIQPLIVLSIVPFGIIGAVAGHFVMGYPMTILSMIGVVALTGIVVNDSMILVTFINQSIRQGVDPKEAVVQGGKSRLRAILLTSATTVLGVAPLLAETSFQAKFLIPMGISISGGLIFATVLTLVAVPSLYLIVIDLKRIGVAAGNWLLGRTQTWTASGPVA